MLQYFSATSLAVLLIISSCSQNNGAAVQALDVTNVPMYCNPTPTAVSGCDSNATCVSAYTIPAYQQGVCAIIAPANNICPTGYQRVTIAGTPYTCLPNIIEGCSTNGPPCSNSTDFCAPITVTGNYNIGYCAPNCSYSNVCGDTLACSAEGWCYVPNS